MHWTWIWVGSESWWWTGSLAYCSPWDRKELDPTEWLNWTELNPQKSYKTEITQAIIEMGSHLFDAMDIKRIMKEYSELLYVHQFDDLIETGQFLKYTVWQNVHKE